MSREAVMPDWGTNPTKGLFFSRFEHIRDSPTPRQSGITAEKSTGLEKIGKSISFHRNLNVDMTHRLKAMWNTMECKKDSFDGSLGGASETRWECVSHRLNEKWYTFSVCVSRSAASATDIISLGTIRVSLRVKAMCHTIWSATHRPKAVWHTDVVVPMVINEFPYFLRTN